jgi:hypothetical protein
MAAQVSLGGVLTAVALFRSKRPVVATALQIAAIWLTIVAPVEADMLRGLGVTVGPTTLARTLALSTALASAAAVLSRPRWVAVVALVGEAALYAITDFIKESDGELAALHVAWFGLLLGLYRFAETSPAEAVPSEPVPAQRAKDDWIMFTLALALAAIVAHVVIQRRFFGGDEWAYTYQAAVFAKGHASGITPPCFKAFQSFYVFERDGRMFSQYTPGWPLFMTPFSRVHAEWLAGPFSFGLLVVGIARVTRRAASGLSRLGDRASEREVHAAAWIAALCTMASSTMLINGGSRFCHVFVCGTYVWSLEALCVITSSLEKKRQWWWGLFLGSSAALLLATRPMDGGALGIGLAIYFVYALIRRRVGWRAVAATAIGFAFWGLLSLVLLRLQLGKWFTTGYSLNEIVHPWNRFKMSLPKAHEIKWHVPLATGSYCWWPLAPALGLAGLVRVRRGEARVPFMLTLGIVPLLIAYGLIEWGRGFDFGYGPRYQLPTIIPMAVGAGILLAPMWISAMSRSAYGRALARGGPAAVALAAAILGVVRIAPLVYPWTYQDMLNHNVVSDKIQEMHLHNAIVWIELNTTRSHPLDLTQNYPYKLYPDPSVLVLFDASPQEKQCVKEHFPGRRSFRTSGVNDVTLIPE